MHSQDARHDGEVAAGGDGRRYLVGAGAAVTLFAATAGFLLAANNAVNGVTVFGTVHVPGTPAAMALYGALLSVLLLLALFSLVSLASRYDEDAT
ncbi:DUF7520 family protein [Halorarum halobium]|uniref:DUF7520 family protein n=1 Tax=Halorarum halobium TaxID=3075121 RepID=UPI0028ABC6CF|nr:hypothetical protein [Halobaculum sp. XH14]